MSNVVVFAGNHTRPEREEFYFSLAYDLGQLLARNKFTVVTGGGPGLMNETLRGAYEAKGRTIGVCLSISGINHSKYARKKYIYKSLHNRVKKLISLGDHFIAIPGGIGTLQEIALVLALKRKKEISRTQQLILIDDYYNEFKSLLLKMKSEGFVREDVDNFHTMVKTPFEAVELLKETQSQEGL